MPSYAWLIIAIVFTLIEIFTAGFFYACFAVGAVAAWVAGLATKSAIWQIIVFCAVSVGLIPITRIFARRVTDESVPQAGADALIGENGIVIEPIEQSENTGTVRVDSQEWRAASEEKIGVGAHVEVIGVKGAKLVVKSIPRKE